MKRKYQILGLFVLILCSVAFEFKKPIQLTKNQEVNKFVVLEGAFLKQGMHEYKGELTIDQLIKDVGVKKDANLNALKLDAYVIDESYLYLPLQNELCVSLNKGTKEELMQLDRIGEKTALKIIEYRKVKPFIYIEDIKNISGIGQKTFLLIRDYICL